MNKMGTNYSWKVWIAMALVGFCLIGKNMGEGVQKFDLSFTSEISVIDLKIELEKCHWRYDYAHNFEQNWSGKQTAELLAKVFRKDKVKIIYFWTAGALLNFNNFNLEYCERDYYLKRRDDCVNIANMIPLVTKPTNCLAYNLAIYCEECADGLTKWCQDKDKIVELNNVDKLFHLNMWGTTGVEDIVRELGECHWKSDKLTDLEQDWSVKQTAELLAKVFRKHKAQIINTLTAQDLLNFNNFHLSYCTRSYYSVRREECASIAIMIQLYSKPTNCLEYNLANYCEACLNGLSQWCQDRGKIIVPINVHNPFQLTMRDKTDVQTTESVRWLEQ